MASRLLSGYDLKPREPGCLSNALTGAGNNTDVEENIMKSTFGATARVVSRFLVSTRAGATSVVTAAIAVMSVAGFALAIDHIWLFDQRDVLKSAASAAAVASTKEMNRRLISHPNLTQADLTAALTPVARNYVELNLAYLPEDQLARAKETLTLTVTPNKGLGTVDVETTSDLGGTLFTRHLPILNNYQGPETVDTQAGVETKVTPVEAVLAIDVSYSMGNMLEGGFPAEGEQSRMDIVKDAAKSLVNILRPNEHNRVAIGVVPWHLTVRLAGATAASWADKRWARYPSERTYGVPYECPETSSTCEPDPVTAPLPASSPEEWKGCLDGHRMGGSGTSAAAPASLDLFTTPSADPFAQAYYPALYGHQYECSPWATPQDYPSDYRRHGCYSSYNPKNIRYGINPPQWGCAGTHPAMLPLSTDHDAILAAIDDLSAIGPKTHSALGVLWGQRMLLPSWRSVWGGDIHPVDPTAENGKGVRKVIVLLTDGHDSVCGSGNVACTDSPIGVSRTEACTRAKNGGTEIFVVAAMHPDQVSTGLGASLTECSSESAGSDLTYTFLNNATPESLQVAFKSIASQLRLVRRVD